MTAWNTGKTFDMNASKFDRNTCMYFKVDEKLSKATED